MFSIKRLLLIEKCLTDMLVITNPKMNCMHFSEEEMNKRKQDYKELEETLADVNILIERHKTNCDE